MKNKNQKSSFFYLAFLALFLVPFFSFASNSRTPDLKIFSGWWNEKSSFPVLDGKFTGGVKVAVGNLDGKGKDEIVIASQKGTSPFVQIYSAKGKLLGQFLAYAEDMKYGVNIAVGDLNNNGKDEIVTAAGSGGGDHVRVFNRHGQMVKYNAGFSAFDGNFTGGVNVAVGDIDGDGFGEIITAAGGGGGPHVRVFGREGNYLGIDYWPFEGDYKGGVSVATADVDNDKVDELVFGKASFGKSQVKVYKGTTSQTILSDFQVWGDWYQGGVNLAGGDIDGDKNDEIAVSIGSSAGPQVRFYKSDGTETKINFFAYEGDFHGGIDVAIGELRGTRKNKMEVVTTPLRRVIQGREDLYKYIEIDLGDQHLYAYKDGVLVNNYLVSTGISGLPTPTGTFKVNSKVKSTTMTGFYGEGSSLNYSLPNVPNVLPFYGDYTIHGAYWHHNFGHRMSHGCVNESLEDAAWLYDWADVGDTVWIHN